MSGTHRVYDSEISVDAKSSEEEDAGVEVEDDQTCASFAQEGAEGPVVSCGREGGPHWQSDKEG